MAILEAYWVKNRVPPPGIKVHSTRAVGASWAVHHRASALQLCKAATWSSIHTFAKFYKIHYYASADASLGRRILQVAVWQQHTPMVPVSPNGGFKKQILRTRLRKAILHSAGVYYGGQRMNFNPILQPACSQRGCSKQNKIRNLTDPFTFLQFTLLTHTPLPFLYKAACTKGCSPEYPAKGKKRTFQSFADLKAAIWDEYSIWRNRFGVLLFLYSVILTKGIENVKNEIEDAEEPLIDPVYGHGSQSLINLLLTGHAVSNVWDGDRECSGMKLLGIHSQAQVGFLTLMESLRYCKVGNFLKSPKCPIWVIGSETHLTVFFTKVSNVND
ncbi:unnamed protein product [Ranitomeya imitator]|uniref:Ubiquitin carboxyl-terminal hydrolase MINDY n=1 Tax=Ranitomeya imitator TaxID=111125 RepID=A0ABN9MCD0_9NEOB|nr:unnamed protein product [Ranitomeya imitator]